jgi:hypothetical protein
LWNSIKSWWNGIDWASLGRAIIDGIVAGINAVGQAIVGAVTGFANAAIDAAKAALGIQSPSTVFYDIGVQIGEGLLAGIESMSENVGQAMFDMLGKVSGLGGGFGNIFQQQTLDPLKQKIDGYTRSIEDMAKDLGLENVGLKDTLLLQRLGGSGPLATTDEEAKARVLLQFLRDRSKLNSEYIQQQERLAQLQEKQQQVNFLQQQFELLKLIKDNNLGTDLLEGLKLGLNADPAALMDAMRAAMQRMIEAAEDQLGIASPSKWAAGLARNVMGTIGATLKGDSRMLQRDVTTAIGGGFNSGARMTTTGATTIVNIDARGAARGVDRDIRRMVEDVLRGYGTRGDIRLRTT